VEPSIFQAIDRALKSIDVDAAKWLETNPVDPLMGWERLLHVYAREQANAQAIEREQAFLRWADRYALDPGQNITTFLHNLCTKTIGEIGENFKGFEGWLTGVSHQVAELKARVERLEGGAQRQVLTVLSNGDSEPSPLFPPKQAQP
jgi:hypothetical protein